MHSDKTAPPYTLTPYNRPWVRKTLLYSSCLFGLCTCFQLSGVLIINFLVSQDMTTSGGKAGGADSIPQPKKPYTCLFSNAIVSYFLSPDHGCLPAHTIKAAVSDAIVKPALQHSFMPLLLSPVNRNTEHVSFKCLSSRRQSIFILHQHSAGYQQGYWA